MIFLMTATLCIIIFIVLLHVFKFSYKYSIGVFVSWMISVICTIALLENYMGGLHISPEGYSLANYLSFLILPDTLWSVDVFKSYFQRSFTITILISFVLIATLLVELKLKSKKQSYQQ